MQRDRGAEHAVGADDVVAGLEQRHARRQDRRHARSGADAGGTPSIAASRSSKQRTVGLVKRE